jgi:FMN phosphatase YigB (HAD superfamily)
MCATLGIDPTASWFIGDHPVFDIWGAHRVGFRTIWLQKRIPWPDDRVPCYTHCVPNIDAALTLVAART